MSKCNEARETSLHFVFCLIVRRLFGRNKSALARNYALLHVQIQWSDMQPFTCAFVYDVQTEEGRCALNGMSFAADSCRISHVSQPEKLSLPLPLASFCRAISRLPYAVRSSFVRFTVFLRAENRYFAYRCFYFRYIP